MTETKIRKDGIFWRGFHDNENSPKYPVWRYHRFKEAIIVKNTDDDERARKEGFEELDLPVTAHTGFVNWFWDLEDFSPNQLVSYAQDEYGVDFPVEAGQERLLKAVFELSKSITQSVNKLVFMAHTIRFKLDETIEEIRKMVDGATDVSTEFFEA